MVNGGVVCVFKSVCDMCLSVCICVCTQVCLFAKCEGLDLFCTAQSRYTYWSLVITQFHYAVNQLIVIIAISSADFSRNQGVFFIMEYISVILATLTAVCLYMCPAISTVVLPCDVTHDSLFGGKYVDCSNRNLTFLDSDWFPDTTTSLVLDGNPLKILTNGTFSRLHHLRSLWIRYCNIHTIEKDALIGLNSLTSLDIASSYSLPLDKHVFPAGMFNHTPRLTYLAINQNVRSAEYQNQTEYRDYLDIFTSLPLLQFLAIDAFPILHVGEEFGLLKHLSTLVIDCDVLMSITNASFDGLRNSNLRDLTLQYSGNYIHFENGAFEPISNISTLRIKKIPIGNKNFLKSLWPFERKSMSVIEASKIYLGHHVATPTGRLHDGVITKQDMGSLRNIKLDKLVWFQNKVLVWEADIFSGTECLLRESLVYIQCVGNLEGLMDEWRILMFQILRFTSLEEVLFTGLVMDGDLQSVQQLETDTCLSDVPDSHSGIISNVRQKIVTDVNGLVVKLPKNLRKFTATKDFC